jgi:hypothetical protein
MYYLSIKLIMTLLWNYRSHLKNLTFSFYSSLNVLVFKSKSSTVTQKILIFEFIYVCQFVIVVVWEQVGHYMFI